MNTQDLTRLLHYRAWARDRVLANLEGMPAADFTKPVVSSFRSIRDTLVHVLSADVIWAARLSGVSPGEHLRPEDFPDVASLRARWEQVDQELRSLVEGLSPNHMVTFRTTVGVEQSQSVAVIIQQVTVHPTYHFGQIATLLRQLGGTPVGIDFIYYDRDGDGR